jgi:signal transduction histidine kinase/ActR/RegA family two-component response regulator
MRLWPRSLQAKLLSVVLFTALVSLTVALGAMVVYDLRSYHRAWAADMTAQAELLGQASAAALAFDDAKVAHDALQSLRMRPQVRAAAVYDARGEIFATYFSGKTELSLPVQPSPDGVQVSGRNITVFKRVVADRDLLGTVYLRADYDLSDRFWLYVQIALGVLVFAMLVAFLMSYRLHRIVTRPILDIGRIAREVVEQKDYSRRAQKFSDDEVGTLVESFNDMMSEIERRSIENENSMRAIAREVNERRVAQQEIMRLNLDLERRVHERTAALEGSNRELALATHAAEHANRAKSEFISSMSHELRTPLNAILGFGQLLAADSDGLTPAKRSEFTRHILRAGNHLLNLINEILDLAKIESANMMLSMEPVSLQHMLAECQAMIEPAASQRNIRMLFSECGRLSVLADRTRLKQVLLNLLSNAIKYNRDDGTVVVDCVASAPGRVRLSVRDTGNGLRPDQIDALFQPFNRLGQETGGVEGTGIGLVVTKRLVELMKGHISVTSTTGIGSVFSIDLQEAEPMPETAAPITVPGVLPSSGGSTAPTHAPLLLYVEDNPANQRLVEEIVSNRGDLRQLSAPDAQLGIELARAHMPQVILMDINLPGLSGRDAQAILRNDPKTAHIPVIAITANAMPRDLAQGLAEGFFRYVTKPIDVQKLNAAIDEALAHAAKPSPKR